MCPLSFDLFGLKAGIRVEYIPHVPVPLEGSDVVSITRYSARATPHLSIIARDTNQRPSEWTIHLAEDGSPCDPIPPLSTFPGYQADQSSTTVETKSMIKAALIDAGVIRDPASVDAVGISLAEHATLKVCGACHRWENIDENEANRLSKCSGCKTAWFCDEKCARVAWSAIHKVGCHYEAAVRLQTALEGQWIRFSTLRLEIESLEARKESLSNQISRIAMEVTFIRQSWERIWPDELALIMQGGDWVPLCNQTTSTHRILEEKQTELFAFERSKDQLRAHLEEAQKTHRKVARKLMGQMAGARTTNTKMLKLETSGVVCMRVEGLQ